MKPFPYHHDLRFNACLCYECIASPHYTASMRSPREFLYLLPFLMASFTGSKGAEFDAARSVLCNFVRFISHRSLGTEHTSISLESGKGTPHMPSGHSIKLNPAVVLTNAHLHPVVVARKGKERGNKRLLELSNMAITLDFSEMFELPRGEANFL